MSHRPQSGVNYEAQPLQISLLLSFDSNSDDNLLKNIELFDRLSLSFNGRVLFIKDVIGDEICCWSFDGQGRKLAEVCCTSIVYATEKKQTKVRMSGITTDAFEKEERQTIHDFHPLVFWR